MLNRSAYTLYIPLLRCLDSRHRDRGFLAVRQIETALLRLGPAQFMLYQGSIIYRGDKFGVGELSLIHI